MITKIKNDFQLTDDLNHLIKTGIIHFKFILESEDRDLVLKLYEFKKLSEELKKY
ncbi:hypothetical protein GM3709_2325 [Geminocystis sp. NIES-3709]|nr:hypothetical protein GM3709_2325 [Geminocystis sp. NIES-3709]